MNPLKERKSNRLKYIEQHKLYNWLESDKEIALQFTAERLASLSTEALGFDVTSSNIDSARRALGIHIRQSRPPFESKGNDRTRELAKCVRHLYTALDIPIPSGLNWIISGKKITTPE